MTQSSRPDFDASFANISGYIFVIKTMPSDEQTFHIDPFGRFALLTLVLFAPVLWIASYSVFTFLIALTFLAISEIVTYFLCTVAVSRDGIVLYRVHRARWQDMIAATRFSFLGLPYWRVQRKKGMKWWVPLYLSKPEEFRQAVAAKAPVGNPLRECAEKELAQ